MACDMSAVCLLESREQRYIKVIKKLIPLSVLRLIAVECCRNMI